MNAIEIYERASGRLERGQISVGEFEEAVAVLKNVEPVVHAKWEEVEPNVIRCSACQEKWSIRDDGDFVIIEAKTDLKRCPTCGAKMDAE